MSVEWPRSVAHLFALCGINPKRLAVNYTLGDDPDKPNGRAVIAVPDIEVALCTDRDVQDGFREAGWIVVHVPAKDLASFHQTFQTLLAVHQANQRSKTLDTDCSTSKHEQWLIDEVLRRNLPPPDRNLRIDNPDRPGQQLTTPDLAWEKEKVAFFVDGLWWHSGKETDKRMKILDADLTDEEKARRMEKEKSLLEKDARIRSVMQLQGWITLNCSDRELERNGGVAEQADRIEKALRARWQERDALRAVTGAAGADLSSLRSLLNTGGSKEE